jgi:integrase
MKLTETSVAKLKPQEKRAHFYDDDLTGFGVRVTPEGRKSFFWFAKVNDYPRFRALGEFPAVTVAEARTDAKTFAGIAAEWKRSGFEGDDPFEKKKRSELTSVPTFRELVEAYITNHINSPDEDERANHPDKAEYQVRWTVKRHFGEWSDRKLDEITVEDVLAVKNACGTRRYLANRAVELIRTLYNWSSEKRDAKINFWKAANPAVDVETFKEAPRKRFLEPDELLRFNNALKKETHQDLKDFLTLAITTGARRSDIFSARWQDVQWERLIWTVPYPKNGESYNVQLLPAALEVLKRRRREIPDTATYIFPGVGETGHLGELRRPWNEFRRRAKLSNFRLHDIRHTNASYAAIAGVPLQTIKEQLGHKSLQSTQVYSHLLDESIRAGRETGQAKMLEMMEAARRRAKLSEPKQKRLAAVTHG